MSQLIPITKTLLGTEEINSVNARDLHGKLNISKDFTSWIKAQIQRADLIKDRDYIEVFTQKGENHKGGRPTASYILTIESAKHIAMMSQSKAAKEIRNYFIEVERRYIADLKRQAEIAPLHNRLNTLESRIERLEQLPPIDRAMGYMDSMVKAAERLIDKTAALHHDRDDGIMTGADLKRLRNAVEERGYQLSRKQKLATQTTIPALYVHLNNRYGVGSYHDIPRAYVQEAIDWLRQAEL